LTIDRSRAKKMHQHYHQMKTVKAILDHERESQHVNSVVTIVKCKLQDGGAQVSLRESSFLGGITPAARAPLGPNPELRGVVAREFLPLLSLELMQP